MKKLTIELTERQVEMAKKFATNQCEGAKDNVGTSFPTIHIVESRGWSTPLADGFGEETHYVFDEETYYTIDSLKEYLCEYFDDFDEKEINDCSDIDELNELLKDYTDHEIEEFAVEEVWKPQAMFFIREEAVAYQKYQSHNLGESRVYTYSIGYGNNGSMKDLGELLLTMGNQLVKEEENAKN